MARLLAVQPQAAQSRAAMLVARLLAVQPRVAQSQADQPVAQSPEVLLSEAAPSLEDLQVAATQRARVSSSENAA